jgi:RNA polymerase sigma-70 factor (ECF subfamily)
MGAVFAINARVRPMGECMAEDSAGHARAEERELIRACLRGDDPSWQRLYRQYRGEAWSVFLRLLGPTADIEDLIQTVFLKVFRSLKHFQGRSKLSTWLYSICVHVALDHQRKRSRQGKKANPDLLPSLPSPEPDPCREAELAEERALLGQALSKMKKAKRTVLVLYDLMDVPAEEIASMLGTPVPTVRSRLFYARRELARLLTRAKGGKR